MMRGYREDLGALANTVHGELLLSCVLAYITVRRTRVPCEDEEEYRTVERRSGRESPVDCVAAAKPAAFSSQLRPGRAAVCRRPLHAGRENPSRVFPDRELRLPGDGAR